MKSITSYKAITRISLPEQALPLLVPVNKAQMKYRRAVGIQESEDGYFCEDVGKMVPVRCISEALGALGTSEKRNAFEAKYGFAIYESTRRDVFFWLMLAQAIAGEDPNRAVQKALRYYGGSRPDGLFGEDSPISQSIREQPLRVVLEILNTGLEKARPIVWWSLAKKRASLGLYCPDGRTALFAMALTGMGMVGGLGVCQRCGNPFHRSRRTQRFCSHRCQLTASMRRFRERHAKARDRNKGKKSQGQRAGRRSRQ